MTESRPRLLYIRPDGPVSAAPVIDEITRKMTGAYRASQTTGRRWRGVHRCQCGARSSNTDYVLPGGAVTNSLCVHYVAFHRADVPADQLAVIDAFDAQADPQPDELTAPPAR